MNKLATLLVGILVMLVLVIGIIITCNANNAGILIIGWGIDILAGLGLIEVIERLAKNGK